METAIATGKPLPPGRLGLPYIGETLPFLSDAFTFFARRRAEHGPVFKTRILGDTVICLVGPEAIRFFYDTRYFTRVKATPPQLRELLNPDAVPFIDQSPHHTARRQLLLQAFTPEAIAGYVPFLERIVGRYLRSWESKKSFRWVPEVQAMCFDIANTLFAGADPDTTDSSVFHHMIAVNEGFIAPPIRLPFSRFGKALHARDQLRTYIHERVSVAKGENTVLARLRAARTTAGEPMDERALEIETLHFYFAAFSAIAGAVVNAGIALADHPEVARRLREEVKTAASPLTRDSLNQLTYLNQFSKELRRFYKLVPETFFARVKEDCEFNGYRLPAGTKAIVGLHATMHGSDAFENPDAFDPDRFAAGKPQRPDSFVPHGGGPWEGHRCAGENLAALVIQVYTTLLLREHTWELTSRDRTLTKGELVPMPKDGLPVRFGRA